MRRKILFIIGFGVLVGVFMSAGLLSVYMLGFWAIYITLLIIVALDVVIVWAFNRIFLHRRRLINIALSGIPIFIVSLLVMQLIVEKGRLLKATASGNLDLIFEWFEYTLLLTLLLAIVSIPVNYFTFKKQNV